MAENNEIDELATEETIEQEPGRGIPSVSNTRKSGGAGQKAAAFIVILLVVLALVAINGGFSSDSDEDDVVQVQKRNDTIFNRLGAAPEPIKLPEPPKVKKEEKPSEPTVIRTGELTAPPPPPSFNTAGSTTTDNGEKPLTPQDRKRGSDMLIGVSDTRNSSASAEEQYRREAMDQIGLPPSMDGAPAEAADGLTANLQPTKVEGARAGLITDRNMFITKGTFLDCALETAISSDVPGMTSCRITEDVYSTSGKVLLIEKGSRIVGEYESGLQRGKARIFVLWTRVETPNGVVVELDSPGTDALGRGGHEGYLDTHFWTRFGSAIMLSLIDDFGTYLANKSNDGGRGNQVNFGGTSDAASDAASIALENSINIPPTLLKNQGEHINVFVARDLDFRGVYELRAGQ